MMAWMYLGRLAAIYVVWAAFGLTWWQALGVAMLAGTTGPEWGSHAG